MNKQASFDLNGSVVLVSGGSGFLGTLFCRALAQAGGSVAIGCLSEEQTVAATLVEELLRDGGQAMSVIIDVTDRSSVDEALRLVSDAWAAPSVLVNNAAIDPKFEAHTDQNQNVFEDYPESLLRASIDVNLLGSVRLTQATLKHMLDAGRGTIINISSLYGLVGPDQRIYPAGTQKPVDYAVTKGGLNVFTRYIATTYGARGIRCNTLTFGGVLKNHDADFQEKYSARVPFGRMVAQSEVGPPLVFLASEASAGMTGQNIVVDGGFTAW